MALRKRAATGRPAWLVSALALVATVTAAAVLTGATAQADSGHRHDDDTLFEFETLAGVSGVFVGDEEPIRGVNGGGLPWSIEEGEIELESDGTLRVRVEGLVLADVEGVPPDLRGTNPVTQFRVALSCLTPEGDIAPPVTSDAFPASTDGDARAKVRLELPDTCFAPIVFVTSPTLAWFAVSGFER